MTKQNTHITPQHIHCFMNNLLYLNVFDMDYLFIPVYPSFGSPGSLSMSLTNLLSLQGL